ncbi:MAG: response regulator [Anaerolineales bacterium]
MAKILVVDADPNNRELIVFALRFAGHEMLSASNREECKNLAQQNRLDIILLDDTLFSPSSIELSKVLKYNEETAKIPLILLLSAENEESIQTGKNGWVDDSIRKSVSPDQLTDKVNSFIKKNSHN